MTSLRFAGIPFDHVIAEASAFPLASEAALRLAIIKLNKDMSENTDRLWQETEKAILREFPAFSVEEIVAIRDKIWFCEPVSNFSLERYLKRIASMFLNVRGPVAIPRLPSDEHRPGMNSEVDAALARRGWRWLSFALPPDLLLAALGDREGGPERIELLSPRLEQHLNEQGFAESHLHLGAGLDFSLLWNAVVYAISAPELKINAFESPGADLNQGRDLCPWLIRAALTRYILVAYLSTRHRRESFSNYLSTVVQERVSFDAGPAAYILLLQCLSDIQQGRLFRENFLFHRLKGLYNQITGIRSYRYPSNLRKLYQADPISDLLWRVNNYETPPENHFVREALYYLETVNQAGAHDTLFATLFWQIIRIRSLFYRYVVQRPMIPGLQWFLRFYERMRRSRQPMHSEAQLQAAAQSCGLDKGLKALEVRIGPSASVSDNLCEIAKLAEVARHLQAGEEQNKSVRRSNQHQTMSGDRPGELKTATLPEIGVLFHFIKDRGGGALQGSPAACWQGSNADPSGKSSNDRTVNPSGYRYASYYSKKRTEAQALGWLLRHFPYSFEIVRGLDVCTDELGVPAWVLSPLFAYVRQASDEAATYLHRVTGKRITPLRTTVHTGEDFVHLLTGLRNIDEAVNNFELNEGDRIGHGLALGIEPYHWATSAGRIAMAREDRLFDLVWEWSRYSRNSGMSQGEIRQNIDNEIAELCRSIFGIIHHPYELVSLTRDLANPSMLQKAGFPHWSASPAVTNEKSPLGLLYKFLTSGEVFRRGREIIWIDPASEAETLKRLQDEMRRKLSEIGISVEVNPTSNLLIGDLGDLKTHPLWRLNPPRGDDNIPSVSVVIGSDDPAIFASNLREEYQWLEDAMKFAGLSDEEALKWLDRVRAGGLENRFTIQSDFSKNILQYSHHSETEPILRP